MRLFQPKVETLTWDEFFQRGVAAAATPPIPKKAAIALAASTLLLLPAMTHAASLGATNTGFMTNHIIHAFWPIISLVQALAYPVSFLGMAGGMLMMSVGQRRKGLDMAKWAAIGFIGMQLVPGIMSMLMQVGHSMATNPGLVVGS